MTLDKVVKVPAEIKAAEILRNAIVDGTIAPGSRITEGELSEQMQLSRATIRSALHQLASEGLTTLKRYAGWSVASLSPNDIWELYTIRSTMERLGARLVAQKINPQAALVINRTLSNLEKQCAAGSWTRIEDADFKFHKDIVSLAGNSRLIAQYALIESQVRMYIRSLDSLFFDASTIVEQHVRIAKAIIAGDSAGAGDLAEAHNLVDGEMLARHLAARELKAPPMRVKMEKQA